MVSRNKPGRMMVGENIFPVGSMYVPVGKATEVPASEWEKDLKRMKKLGFTVFRSWAAWDRIEKEEGKRDFKPLDLIFNLAGRHHLKIVLTLGSAFGNLGGIYPPLWLLKKYHAESFIEDPWLISKQYGFRRTVCFDDPIVCEKFENFLVETVQRYARSKALFCWCLWNEPFWKGCFCKYTLTGFRNWLKKKYSSLESLSAAWSTESPVYYDDWDEVEPPKESGFWTSGYVPWIDWQEFCEDQLTSKVARINSLVKKHDAFKHFTTVNVTPFDLDSRSAANKNNFWKVAKEVDVIGISHYPSQQFLAEDKPFAMACYLDRVRSASKTGRFWGLETDAGPVLWSQNMSPYFISSRERVLRYWQMVGHNAKAVISWLYRTRTSDAQAGEFGLVAWDGSYTERAVENGKFAQTIKKYDSFFLNIERADSKVAILASHSTLRLGAAEGYEDGKNPRTQYWQKSWMGAYKLFWDLNIAVDFIDDEQIVNDCLQNYRLLIAPFRTNMNERVAERIATFVKKGGSVVADFPFGFKDDRGILHCKSPGCGLDKIFGYHCVDVTPAVDSRVEWSSGSEKKREVSIKTHLFQQEFILQKSAKVIGRFASSKKAAIIANDFGKGKTLSIGTMLFPGYLETSDKIISGLIKWWLKEIRLRENVIVEGEPKNIEVCKFVHKKTDEKVLVVLNHNEVNKKLFVRFNNRNVKKMTEMITGRKFKVSEDTASIEIKGKETIVLIEK